MKHSLVSIIRLNWNYLFIGIALLLVEIFIAACLHDTFIRPYGGDFLAVILLFCFVRAFFDLPVLPVAVVVLLFSYFVEWTQFMRLADHLQLGSHSLLRVLIGDYFTWTDILCYSFGMATVIVFEKIKSNGVLVSLFECSLDQTILYPDKLSSKRTGG